MQGGWSTAGSQKELRVPPGDTLPGPDPTCGKPRTSLTTPTHAPIFDVDRMRAVGDGGHGEGADGGAPTEYAKRQNQPFFSFFSFFPLADFAASALGRVLAT